MRRLNGPRRDERGAMVIFLAAFSVVMVGMAALVIDVGSLLDEKRQIQNGADAGALAIAQSCALGACRPDLAGSLANDNSRDGSSAGTPAIDTANKRVTVTTRTLAGGTSILPYSFAQILTGVKGKEVVASATASWAPLGRAVVLRLAISQCDVDQLGFSTSPQTLLFHVPQPGCDASSGHDASGAFGWLDDDRPPSGSTCELTVNAGQTASANPGASGPTECLDPYFPMDVLLPVFDDVRGVIGTGQNATYLIKGFARFRMTGYRFPGTGASSVSPPCSSPNSCIRGNFVRYVTTAEPTTGGAADFGVSSVKLVS